MSEGFMVEDVNEDTVQGWLNSTDERYVCTVMINNRVYNEVRQTGQHRYCGNLRHHEAPDLSVCFEHDGAS